MRKFNYSGYVEIDAGEFVMIRQMEEGGIKGGIDDTYIYLEQENSL